mgnify:FL=1
MKIKLSKHCLICEKKFYKSPYISLKEWNNITRFCSVKCKCHWMSQNFYGNKIWNWKGGTITSRGYKSLSIRGKRILEHRLVMEKFLKRKLKTKEHVHHLNKNKLDNRIENLKLLTDKQHSQLNYPGGSKFGINSISNKRIKRTKEYWKQYSRNWAKNNPEKVRINYFNYLIRHKLR